MLSSDPAASPSLQTFQESASCFLALLLKLLAEPADSEMRLCQQSLLVRMPLSPFVSPSPPRDRNCGAWCVCQGEHRLRTLLPAAGYDAFL